MKDPHSNQRGFTLLEVLIALSLMAVLSILSWRALDITASSSERLEASADDTLALLRVLGQIESDIGRHAGAGILSSPPQWDNRAEPPSPAARDLILPPGIRWSPEELTVLRYTHEGAWQEVVWHLAGGTLLRAAGAPARSLPLPPAQAGEAMLGGVGAFTVRAWLPGRGWSDAAPGEAPIAATGLEIAIERHRNGVNESYRKVVLLP